MSKIMKLIAVFALMISTVFGGYAYMTFAADASHATMQNEVSVEQVGENQFTIKSNYVVETAYVGDAFSEGTDLFTIEENVNNEYVTNIINDSIKATSGTTGAAFNRIDDSINNQTILSFVPTGAAPHYNYWVIGNTLSTVGKSFNGVYTIDTVVPEFVDASLLNAEGNTLFPIRNSNYDLKENGTIVNQQSYGNLNFVYGISSLQVEYVGLPEGHGKGINHGGTVVNALYAPTSYRGYIADANVTAPENTMLDEASIASETTTFTGIDTYEVGDIFTAADGKEYRCTAVSIPETGTYNSGAGTYVVNETSGSHNVVYTFEPTAVTLTYDGLGLVSQNETLDIHSEVIIDFGYDGIADDRVTMDTNKTIPNPTRDGYIFNGFEYDAETKTLTANWLEDILEDTDKDENGAATGDGIADIYQTVVTYKVENGTWDGTDNADKTEVVTFYKDKVLSTEADAIATLSKPEDMEANTGYENGTWDKEETSITYEEKDSKYEFTHSFVIKGYDVTYPGVSGDGLVKLPHGTLVTIDNVNGTDNREITIEQVENLEAPIKDKAIFDGYTYDAETKTFTANWLEDENNDKIHDIFQTKVIYKIVNGQWNTRNTVSEEWITFTLDGAYSTEANAAALLTNIPASMSPMSGYDITTGQWIAVPPSEVTYTTDVLVFTYYYQEQLNVSYFGKPESGLGQLLDENILFNRGEIITVNDHNGSEIYTITLSEDTALVQPTREGYTFVGYTYDAETKTLNASWDKNVYSVTFDTDGGTDIAPVILSEGDYITVPSIPTKEGFTFEGWYLDAEFTQKFDFETMTMPANGITLYAKFVEDKTSTTPTTGDDMPIAALMMAAVVSGLGVIRLKRKKEIN